MDYLILFLSWYVAAFTMSMWHGYNRYKHFRENKALAMTCAVIVSLVWPFVIPSLLLGIPTFVFMVSLFGVFRNGYDYLTTFMDNVVRRALK